MTCSAPTGSALPWTEILQRFGALRVVVLGDFIADVYLFGTASRMSREAPVPVVEVVREEVRPGGAGNVAANLRALGAEVECIGYIGQGAGQAAMQQALAESGVRVRQMVPYDADLRKVRLFAGAPGAQPQQIARFDTPFPSPSRELHRPVAARARTALQRGVNLVVVSDYGLGACAPSAIDALHVALNACRYRWPLVAVDARQDVGRYFGVADAVKINVAELEALGHGCGDDAGRRVVAAMRPGAKLLVTHGAAGAVLYDANAPSIRIPAFGPIEAVDVTGAGDSVLAVFALALAAGASGLAAAQLAVIAGGLAVQKVGTVVVGLAALQAVVDGRTES